jgi:hypothetical protein
MKIKGVEVQVHRSTPQPLYPTKRAAGIRWIGGWVGPRVGLDSGENRKISLLPGIKLRFLRHRTRRPSLYQISYPAFSLQVVRMIISSNIKWVGHVARMGVARNAYNILVRKLERRRPHGRLDYVKAGGA